MFDPNSRYAAVPNAVFIEPDGTRSIYKRRRLLPQGHHVRDVRVETVRVADRLDSVAARALGDSLQFWRIADANDAMDPFDLVEPGRALAVPTTAFRPPDR